MIAVSKLSHLLFGSTHGSMRAALPLQPWDMPSCHGHCTLNEVTNEKCAAEGLNKQECGQAKWLLLWT